MTEDELRAGQARGLLPEVGGKVEALHHGKHCGDGEGRRPFRQVAGEDAAVALSKDAVHPTCMDTKKMEERLNARYVSKPQRCRHY